MKIINKENDFEFENVKKNLTMQFKCIITLESFVDKVIILITKYITGKYNNYIKGKKWNKTNRRCSGETDWRRFGFS